MIRSFVCEKGDVRCDAWALELRASTHFPLDGIGCVWVAYCIPRGTQVQRMSFADKKLAQLLPGLWMGLLPYSPLPGARRASNKGILKVSSSSYSYQLK